MYFKKPNFWKKTKISIWSILLFPISIFLIILFNISKLRKAKEFPIPLICIGNIYLGGTGKTPLASEIFKIITLLGKNPGLVKKYYNFIEDEIELLKKIGQVYVSKNRIDAINSLIDDNKNIAILDDGFQDNTIKKQFSILCFSQKQWIGNGFTIPSGPLREKFSSIKKANCIFINGNKDINIENKIYKHNKEANIYYSKYKALDIDRFKNKKIIAFAGIGNPSNFFDLLKDNNLTLVEEISFPDHYNFKKKDLDFLQKKAHDHKGILLTTEKDYYRIKNKINIDYLKIELEIENKESLINLIKKYI